jgi:aminopeptidase N
MLRLPACLLLCALPLLADDTDVRHVKLDLDIDPVGRTVGGTVTTTVRSTIAALTTFSLRLHANMAVSTVLLNGNPPGWTRPTDAVNVTLDRAYGVGEEFTVAITYLGSPANLGFGSFQWGTHGGSATVVGSLSETDFAYTWWPAKMANTDKFTTETWAAVPSTLTAVSNGRLAGTDDLGARKRFRWETAYPIAHYLVSLAISNYQVRTDTYTHMGANMPVVFYAYPENYAAQQTNMNRLVPMLTVFSNLFGQYPFVNDKAGIAQFNWGGGMENQTVSSQSDFGESLSAHELGHQWWGDMITCGTWHDIWLNEGFATYCVALWDENKVGGGTTAYFSRMNANRPSSPGTTGSVYVTDISNLNNIFSDTNVYRKGAWVLHQLRHVVGDATFFQILRDYRTAKQYDSAITDEFAAIASATYGQDLTWFFNQCVRRTGAPTFSLAWSPQTLGGQNYVFLNVGQTQTAAAWRFPVDLRVTTAGGPVTSVAWIDQKRDDVVLPANGAATAVALDPGPWILKGTTVNGTFSASLTASPASIPSTGGTATLALSAGLNHMNRGYVVLGSLTGVLPGIPLPEGKVLPLVFDGFTTAVLYSLNTPTFANFLGTLSGTGQATASLVIPNLGPIGAGITTYYAWVTNTAPYFTSTPVAVTITP